MISKLTINNLIYTIFFLMIATSSCCFSETHVLMAKVFLGYLIGRSHESIQVTITKDEPITARELKDNIVEREPEIDAKDLRIIINGKECKTEEIKLSDLCEGNKTINIHTAQSLSQEAKGIIILKPLKKKTRCSIM